MSFNTHSTLHALRVVIPARIGKSFYLRTAGGRNAAAALRFAAWWVKVLSKSVVFFIQSLRDFQTVRAYTIAVQKYIVRFL